MAQYRALLLDADDTLFDFQASQGRALEETFQKMGYAFSKNVQEIYHHTSDRLWKQLERGEITLDQLRTLRFSQCLQELGLPHCENAENFYEESLSQQSILLPYAQEICEKLSKKYSLYIVTNGIPFIQRRRFEASPLVPYIQRLFISGEFHTQKPQKEFYDKILSQIGLSNKDCLMIGDSMTSDILGGINASIDTCWFNPHHKEPVYPATYTIADLRELYTILDR